MIRRRMVVVLLAVAYGLIAPYGWTCKWNVRCKGGDDVEAGLWRRAVCTECRIEAEAAVQYLRAVTPLSVVKPKPRWLTKKAARRLGLAKARVAAAPRASGGGILTTADEIVELQAALRCLSFTASCPETGSLVVRSEASSMTMEDTPSAERPFIQWGKPLVFLKKDRSIKKFFASLYYEGIDAGKHARRWEKLVASGEVFSLTDRLVCFLQRVCEELGADTRDGIYDRIMADRRVIWVTSKINTIAVDFSIPLTRRDALSADCAEAHALELVAKRGLDGDAQEILIKAIRLHLTPLQNMQRRPPIQASWYFRARPDECFVS
jgi:hypothetical protein